MRTIIVIQSPPFISASAKEGLDTALALGVFNIDVQVVLTGEGLLHAIAPNPSSDNTAPTHGATSLFSNLGALELYDLPKAVALESEVDTWLKGHSLPDWLSTCSDWQSLFQSTYHLQLF